MEGLVSGGSLDDRAPLLSSVECGKRKVGNGWTGPWQARRVSNSLTAGTTHAAMRKDRGRRLQSLEAERAQRGNDQACHFVAR